MAGVIYYSKRLHRYRGKYKEEAKQVTKMQEEVDNMEQFGGQAGTKDEALEMMQNPLAVQMQQMQARLDRKNAEVQQEERKRKEDESEARQEHINALQGDRDKLQQELEKLRQDLIMSQPTSRGGAAPVAVPVSAAASVGVGRGPAKVAVRAEFDIGRPAGRKKKDVE